MLGPQEDRAVDVHNLDRIFKPQRIVVLGANENPRSVGSTVLRNLIGGGYRGVVYPVHATLEAAQGVHCYRTVGELPRVPDLAVICSAAATVPEVVRECGEAGVRGVIVVSAGFREAGPDGIALEQRLRAEIARFDGMRVLGPNCLGILVPHIGLNASFAAAAAPQKGDVAFISQSGALCTAVLDWALDENIGFSHFVSVGNMLDVNFGDLIDYFGENDECASILLYMESLRDARRFLSAARAFARTKPIVAYKAGRFEESAKAAGSHTGAMAGEDAIYQAAFERAGITRVYEIGDIFDCAELIARHPSPRGQRLGIVTNAGGPGVMALDALMEAGGTPAKLSATTLAALDELLPPSWSHGNPVDVLGDSPPKRMARAVEVTLADSGVDAILVILTPQAMTKPTQAARSLAELAASSHKPILAAWLGGRSMREGIDLLNRAGVATYATPEQAVQAFMTLASHARNIEILYEVPRDVPVDFTVDRDGVRAQFAAMLGTEGDVFSESASKSLLAAYGIPVAETRLARTADEAADLVGALDHAAVMKIASPDITHKSDAGGVILDVRGERAAREAFDALIAGARGAGASRIEGATVQPMVRAEGSIELILGMRRDPVFGPVILAGLGGTTAEVLGDTSLGFPPLNERLARRMLESLRIWPLLQGYRNRPAVDLERLIEILIRFSYLASELPEIRELDVNPLLVWPEGVCALDARVLVDKTVVWDPARPYAHLALRPYPEEYVRPAVLAGGGAVTLRPIRPEDEPRWMEMLSSCSRESIYARFRGFIQWDVHPIAVRYCYIDYDRELAIVAEVGEGAERKLAGVGRLVADPDLQSADFAVLVADPWQGQGMGTILTEYCVELATHWGVKQIIAETSTGNTRMRRVFERLGFATTVQDDEDTVLAVKQLT
jgi:acetyltransferase